MLRLIYQVVKENILSLETDTSLRSSQKTKEMGFACVVSKH